MNRTTILPLIDKSLPPHGGSGLKYWDKARNKYVIQSPSTRREWIEMDVGGAANILSVTSPSTRREWIEIDFGFLKRGNEFVSLHTEGVD